MDVDRPRCSYYVVSVIFDAIFRDTRWRIHLARETTIILFLTSESRLMTKPECSNVRTYIAHLKATQTLKQT